jgi:tetratricopeptide (TPR) repeat protein
MVTDAKINATRAVCLALFLGTLFLFARTIGNDFVNYDDPDYVTKNEHVMAGLGWPGVKWAFTSGDISYWHPLTWVSHQIDWSLFGDRPAGHHATSVALHALNAVLAFLVFRRLTGACWASAGAAALFAWHPLRVESVAWIAERKDVLSGFFWLLALWAYAAYAERRRRNHPGAWRAYSGALAAFAAGLMSKPSVVAFPVVLLALDFWPLRRLALAPPDAGAKTERLRFESPGQLLVEKIPFLCLSAAVSAITVIAQQKVGTLSTVLSLDARLANAVVGTARYLGKLVWPLDLAVLYPHPGRWPAPAVAGALALFVGISGLAWVQRRRRPWLLTGWAWWLVALAPMAGLVQVGIQSIADRYTYIPMLGVHLAILWTLRDAFSTPSARRTLALAGVAVLVACAGRTWHQQGVWRNSLTLFEHAVAVTEKNYLAHNNIGTHLAQLERHADAVDHYRRSLAINPGYGEASNNLGHALARLGQTGEAVEHYRRALRTKPDLIEARNNLGNALSDLGQVDEALAHYEFVLARQPNHADALMNYGVALAMKGSLPAAEEKLRASLRLRPGSASAQSNLGNVLAMTGRHAEAIASYRSALALNSRDAQTFNNLANVYAQTGALDDAVAHYRQALSLAPVNPEAHANLSRVLLRQGRHEVALQHAQRALQQRPGYAEAQALVQQLTAPAPAPAK